MITQFEDFFKLWKDVEFDEVLLRGVLANADLKHGLAKYIVERIVYHDDYYLRQHNNVDVRLQCFVSYYLVKEILNTGMDVEKAQELATGSIGDCRIGKGCYLPDLTFSSLDSSVPVRMCPGVDIHLGYRTFIVNLLCFNSKKFLMGCRCDSGPVIAMKYHKGCKPVGIRKGANGIEWTVFQVDRDLTDDNTAVFSNGLDGDGTIEVCDWISDAEQRVVFRENY